MQPEGQRPGRQMRFFIEAKATSGESGRKRSVASATSRLSAPMVQ